MNIFTQFLSWVAQAMMRKKRDAQWASRFTNPPAMGKDKLPLDPGNTPGIG